MSKVLSTILKVSYEFQNPIIHRVFNGLYISSDGKNMYKFTVCYVWWEGLESPSGHNQNPNPTCDISGTGGASMTGGVYCLVTSTLLNLSLMYFKAASISVWLPTQKRETHKTWILI